ncbi:MAG TPA: class I SAM-dependent methyltransferase [Thermoanaerobaculia bacterium]|nr:class I SAM-dependent methyltransferase [Thermoanaerobaculia bacterium]
MPNVYQFKDFDGSSHRILLWLVERFARNRGTLLDLGASGGHLGEALRHHFDRTIGFEFDVDRIGDLAERFDHAVISDLDRVSRLPSEMNAIVMADVLEHLRDPAQALRVARQALADSGYLFVSVPNIANLTIRLGLLFGVFRYRDRGILDSTHLRFYTARTIREEVEQAGFEIVQTTGSAVPVRLVIGNRIPEAIMRPSESLLSHVTQLWKGLLAYQIILVARKK